jgi:hypothetical protein
MSLRPENTRCLECHSALQYVNQAMHKATQASRTERSTSASELCNMVGNGRSSDADKLQESHGMIHVCLISKIPPASIGR